MSSLVEYRSSGVYVVSPDPNPTTAPGGAKINAGLKALVDTTITNAAAIATKAPAAQGVASASGTAPLTLSLDTSSHALTGSVSAATTSAPGTMSAADKTKLDGVASGATANTGTVTSVGLSLPAGLTVTVPTVTTTGTLTATWANQQSNKVFAAPNGSTGTPTFRLLTVADTSDWSTETSSLALSMAALSLSNFVGTGPTPTASPVFVSPSLATVPVTMRLPAAKVSTVTNKRLTSNVATLTVDYHNLKVGETVVITGVDSTFNGTYVVSSVPTFPTGNFDTEFSYAKVHANVTSTAASGTVTGTQTANVAEWQSGTGANVASINGSGNLTATAVTTPSLVSTGTLATKVVTKMASYTLSTTETVCLANTTGGAITITLPAASGCANRQYVVKKIDSTGTPVSIARTGSDTIDGATSQSLAIQYEALTFVSDGTNWHII